MKKHRLKKIVVFLQIFVFSFEISFGTSTIWTKGSGTKTDPYLIESSANLEYLAEMLHFGGVSGYKDVYFRLTTNIKYKGEGIEEFNGYFDGGNFTITQTSTSSLFPYLMLFQSLRDATISNLVVENFGLAGSVYGGTTITNCSMIGETKTALVDKIYGDNNTISYCSNYATIAARDSDKNIGGICSYIYSSASNNKIIACYNVGSITGGRETQWFGGILGSRDNTRNNSIVNCYNTGQLISQYFSSSVELDGIGNAKVVKGCYTTGGYYIKGSGVDNYKIGIDVSSSIAKTQDFVDRLNFDGEVFIMDFTPNTNSGYPIIAKSVDVKVTSSNTSMGSVSGGGSIKQGQVITISATPKTGYHFVQWNDGNTNASRSITVTTAATYTATFAINTYALTVTSNNTTMGTVSGGGTYDYNKSVTITATPNEHYHFVKWNDGNTNASRSVTITANATYTATFAIDTHVLTVTSDDTTMGAVIGGGTYDYNESVTITATPETGYHFVEWTDGNANASRSVTVTADATYTATFAINTYTLQVFSADEELGTVIGGGTFDYNKEQTIVATATKDHYHFWKWNDGITTNPRTILVTEDGSYTANFVLDTFALATTVNDAIMGMTSGDGNYAYNSSATATATANYGYVFKKWNDGNTDNSRVVTITNNINLVANFVLDTFNISASSNDVSKGIVTGAGKYPYNTETILSANATEHYHFVKWNDGNIANPRTVIVTKDASYSAVFAIDTFAISVVVNDVEMGTVTGAGKYIYGSEQDLEATANYGYVFKNWKDGETAAQRTITVTKNATYTAVFEKEVFSVSITSTDESKGTVSAGGKIAYLSEIQLIATPKEHYHFVKWSDGDLNATRIVTVTKDLNLTAEFAIDEFILTVEESENGTVTGEGNYAYNTPVTLTATPNEHYHFVQWSDGEKTNPHQIIVSNNATYKAEFAIDEFTVSLSTDAEMGTVQGNGSYEYGQNITISATPNYGYEFKQWSDGNTSALREIVVLDNIEMEAQFKKTIFSVNIASNDETKGTIFINGQNEYLSEIQLVANPKEHYHFVKWSDGNTNASRSIIVTENVNLTAEFAIDVFELSIENCENGVISGAGKYAYNTDVTLTAIPDEHYHFVKWNDGATTNPHQIIVSNNATYKAEFAIDEFTVSLSTDAEMGTVQGNGSYEYGQNITISATPNYGYEFKQWSDGNTSALREIVVLDNIDMEAQFEKTTFSVNIISNDETKGSVTAGGEIVYNSELQLEATAKEHCHFVKWSDGNTDNPRVIIVTEAMNLTAEFAIDTFIVTLSVNKEDMGSVQGAGEYVYGQISTISAKPNEHFSFVKWSDENTEDIREITITENVAYKAIFEKQTYIVDVVSSDDDMGSVKIIGNSFYYGDEIVLSAKANNGYYFVKWSDGDENATRTYKIGGNKILIAYFEGSTAIQEVEQSHEVTISNRQIFVNGEAPAFVITSVGQKIANQNLKAGIYFVQVGNEMQGVTVKSR